MDAKTLVDKGYEICNARINAAMLKLNNNKQLVLYLALQGSNWSVNFGGIPLNETHPYFGANFIAGIFNTVGVDDFYQLENKNVRVAIKDWDGPVEYIGNIIDDVWFDVHMMSKLYEQTTAEDSSESEG